MTKKNNVMSTPTYKYVSTSSKFYFFLEEIEDAKWIAYDTEFISEGRFLPELCLLQVATEKGNFLIDPLTVSDITPFWERLCDGRSVSIIHACRSELEFCYRAVKKFPAQIFDVQIAAAFLGLGYPLNLKTLAQQTAKVQLAKSETLTDWRKRPLLISQLDYAIHDVCHLYQIYEHLRDRLSERGRLGWFEDEMAEYCRELQASLDDNEGWRKLHGVKGMSRTELAIVRELYEWRRERALRNGTPVGRILRDDVLVNVARSKTSDPQRIAVVRGVNMRPQAPIVLEAAQAISRAMQLSEAEKPQSHTPTYPTYEIATQLVYVLLAQYCKRHEISNTIVAHSADIRKALAHYEGKLKGEEGSKLFVGWRAEFLGSFLDSVLSGRYAMLLSEDLDGDPLRIIDVSGATFKSALENEGQ